jgi:hypothetical protein
MFLSRRIAEDFVHAETGNRSRWKSALLIQAPVTFSPESNSLAEKRLFYFRNLTRNFSGFRRISSVMRPSRCFPGQRSCLIGVLLLFFSAMFGVNQ